MDNEAFENAVVTHKDRVHAYAAMMLRDATEAQDVAQEALVRLWQFRGQVGERGARPWLMRTAHNLCIDRIRRRKVRAEVEDGEAVMERQADDNPGPWQLAEAGELGRRIDEALGSLPSMDRAVHRDARGPGPALRRDRPDPGAAPGNVESPSPPRPRAAAEPVEPGGSDAMVEDERRRGVSCETARERIHRLLDGELMDAVRRQELEAHLDCCADCRRAREELGARAGRARRPPRAPAPRRGPAGGLAADDAERPRGAGAVGPALARLAAGRGRGRPGPGAVRRLERRRGPGRADARRRWPAPSRRSAWCSV